MPRRFALQLDRGRKAGPPPPPLPAGVPDVAIWRCSRCMVRGICPPHLAIGRPEGKACGAFECRDARWIPDNAQARSVDKALNFDPHPTLGDMNAHQHRAAACIDGAILGGQWQRLTSSCEPHIVNAVRLALRAELGPHLFVNTFQFDYNTDTMRVGFKARGQKDDAFVVRYRWFQ